MEREIFMRIYLAGACGMLPIAVMCLWVHEWLAAAACLLMMAVGFGNVIRLYRKGDQP